MIKANELRTGNIVIFDKDDIMTVEEITATTVSTSFSNGDTVYEGSLYEIEPVPLTEQWLLDFGFKVLPNAWDDMVFWSVDEKFTGFTLQETEQGYINGNDRIIPSVHLLQNAYFFDQLDGSELTLKNQTV